MKIVLEDGVILEGTIEELLEFIEKFKKPTTRGTTVEEVIINSHEAETIETNMIGHYPSIEITGRHYDAYVHFKNDRFIRVEVFIPAHVNVKPTEYIKELFV
jgi:hypothetical protein